MNILLTGYTSTSYFLYLRLRSAMKTYGPLPEHTTEEWIGPGRDSQGTVTHIYNSQLDCSIKTLAVEKVWDRKLHSIGLEQDWETVWSE